jgi:hypothetical protein
MTVIHECDSGDHRLESYALGDRRLLEAVAAFDRELVAGFASGLDLTAALAALDPDPARYTWIKEKNKRKQKENKTTKKKKKTKGQS